MYRETLSCKIGPHTEGPNEQTGPNRPDEMNDLNDLSGDKKATAFNAKSVQ